MQTAGGRSLARSAGFSHSPATPAQVISQVYAVMLTVNGKRQTDRCQRTGTSWLVRIRAQSLARAMKSGYVAYIDLDLSPTFASLSSHQYPSFVNGVTALCGEAMRLRLLGDLHIAYVGRTGNDVRVTFEGYNKNFIEYPYKEFVAQQAVTHENGSFKMPICESSGYPASSRPSIEPKFSTYLEFSTFLEPTYSGEYIRDEGKEIDLYAIYDPKPEKNNAYTSGPEPSIANLSPNIHISNTGAPVYNSHGGIVFSESDWSSNYSFDSESRAVLDTLGTYPSNIGAFEKNLDGFWMVPTSDDGSHRSFGLEPDTPVTRTEAFEPKSGGLVMISESDESGGNHPFRLGSDCSTGTPKYNLEDENTRRLGPYDSGYTSDANLSRAKSTSSIDPIKTGTSERNFDNFMVFFLSGFNEGDRSPHSEQGEVTGHPDGSMNAINHKADEDMVNFEFGRGSHGASGLGPGRVNSTLDAYFTGSRTSEQGSKLNRSYNHRPYKPKAAISPLGNVVGSPGRNSSGSMRSFGSGEGSNYRSGAYDTLDSCFIGEGAFGQKFNSNRGRDHSFHTNSGVVAGARDSIMGRSEQNPDGGMRGFEFGGSNFYPNPKSGGVDDTLDTYFTSTETLGQNLNYNGGHDHPFYVKPGVVIGAPDCSVGIPEYSSGGVMWDFESGGDSNYRSDLEPGGLTRESNWSSDGLFGLEPGGVTSSPNTYSTKIGDPGQNHNGMELYLNFWGSAGVVT